MNEPPPSDPARQAAEADDLVRFFRSLRPAVLAEYEALAQADRAHGEDVSGGDDKERP